ncbi:MAG: flagellar hook assembly protein FlgD [Deltaproteobacteria bacterium]|nr:flagellar hook assembly protein FlgD [Deltaproteobacteria bacterium]
MLEGISGIPMVADKSKNNYTEKSKEVMGRDDFLKMFLAQMRHQDPLNPMDTQQFSAQLAQFSSLEQLYNVNETLEAIKESEAGLGRYQALSFIGKEVLAEGDRIPLVEGKEGKAAFRIPEKADCTVHIVNDEGQLLRKIPLGVLQAGRHDFTWDGKNDLGGTMPPGTYRFEVSARSISGAAVKAETLIRGLVEKINLEGNSPLLYVGEIPLRLSQILDIRAPADIQGGGESVGGDS